jgi:hypothetical protein
VSTRKLDVRWPVELLTRAEGIALGAGVKTAEVLRRAAEAGLSQAAAELRPGPAARPSKMPSAGADGSPAVQAGAAPRPAPATPAASRVRLDVAVARLLEGGHDGGPAPVSLARARRKIGAEEVRVGGVVCDDTADTLVDPREVSLDG